MLHDIAREAHELIQRGLDHFAQGHLREAVQVWECAVRLQPQDKQSARLLAFARRRLREGEDEPVRTRHDTLESPIPALLASLTAVEDEGSGKHVEPEPDDEWAKVDTRRVLASMDDLNDCDLVSSDVSDTWKEIPVQDDKLQSGVRGLIDECQTALDGGRADSAALAAEMALQMCEQSNAYGVDEVITPARPLLERAFSSFIGDMRCTPIRAIPAEDLASYGFDHRAAFLMSRMDGATSVQDLLLLAGMPQFDALRLIASLKRARAIELVPVLV